MGGSKSANPPDWTPALLMAKEFGVPPWVIEEQCTHTWLTRWSAYKTAEAMEQERRAKRG